MWWLQKREEGRNVPSNDACSAVTKETCDLLRVGDTTSAFRGVGRRGGEKKQAGEALIKSRQILAAIRNSLMRISQHVFNTCCSLMLPSGDVGARRMAASRTRATDFFSLEGLSPAPAPSTPLFFGVEPSLLTHHEQHLD